MQPRILLIVAAVGTPLVIGGLWLSRPGPERQVEQLFATLSEELSDGRAAEVFDLLSDDYDFRAQWPQLDLIDGYYRRARQRVADHPGADVEPVVRQSLKTDFVRWVAPQQLTSDISVAYTVHAVTVNDDGSFEATVSLATDGFRPDLELERHRFTLVSRGWLRPEARIRAHDPIALN